MKFKSRQCAKCPWKTSTNFSDIPNGYSADKHAALINTIADEVPVIEQLNAIIDKTAFHIMSCHEHDDVACAGWVHNQLQNNNLQLRLVISKTNKKLPVVVGEQHERFADMLIE